MQLSGERSWTEAPLVSAPQSRRSQINRLDKVVIGRHDAGGGGGDDDDADDDDGDDEDDDDDDDDATRHQPSRRQERRILSRSEGPETEDRSGGVGEQVFAPVVLAGARLRKA